MAKAWGYKVGEWYEEKPEYRAEAMTLVFWEAIVEARRQEWREEKRKKEEDRDHDRERFNEMRRRRAV